MPISKRRSPKNAGGSPSETLRSVKAMQPNPGWYAPVMVSLMVFGLLWIVVVYLSGGQLPVSSWGNWNLAVGFGFIVAGFLMTTNWR